MEKYRKKKSELLEERYQMVRNGVTKKYGSLDRVPQNGNQPLENKTDQMILEKMIFNKTFAILPYMCDDQYMRSVYTIGCWYYWQIPEIVLHFKENVEFDSQLVHMIISRIHARLYDRYKETIDQKINHTIDQKINHTIEQTIDLTIDHNVRLSLTLVDPDNLIDINTPYMLWFYTFWNHIDPQDDQETACIYPVYRIDMDSETIDHLKNMFIGNLIDRFEAVVSDSKDDLSDDFELSSDGDELP